MFMLEMVIFFLVIVFCVYMVIYTTKKNITDSKKNAENIVKSYAATTDNSANFGVNDSAPSIDCPECGGKMSLNGNVYICDACGYTLKRDGAENI